MKLTITQADNDAAVDIREHHLDIYDVCSHCPTAIAANRQLGKPDHQVNFTTLHHYDVGILGYFPLTLTRSIQQWDHNKTPILGEFEILSEPQTEEPI